jgi:putative restriction endonuclease
MNIILDNHDYKVVDTKEKITIADSFVVRQNKIGGGNGEAKLIHWTRCS